MILLRTFILKDHLFQKKALLFGSDWQYQEQDKFFIHAFLSSISSSYCSFKFFKSLHPSCCSINKCSWIIVMNHLLQRYVLHQNLFGLWRAFRQHLQSVLSRAWYCSIAALPNLVIESSKITTSFVSTNLLAFSITISATATCLDAGSSNVDATTSFLIFAYLFLQPLINVKPLNNIRDGLQL